MSYNDKLQKAKELIELTGTGKRMDSGLPRSEQLKALRQEQECRLLDLNIELLAKHMSEEQLDVLLNFYKSDMGQSILEANKAISAEFRDRFNQTMSFSTPSDNGAFWIASSSDNAGKRDT
ncbi:MAG: DUF2059 domain-containing protein [Parvibaculum sp.]|nr:DUF2059 domain-containing protein [Parvibaculum sp.]